MYEVLYDIAKSTITLFIILDPLGNIPIFLNMTEKMSQAKRRKVFGSAASIALLLLITFTLLGEKLLNIFGISLDSFMIAGGTLLLIIAIKLLVFGEWTEKVSAPESMGAFPLACPLLVGPGAITTTIILLQSNGVLITLAAILINFTFLLLVLHFIESIHKFLGKIGAAVIARVMAVFISAIAVGYIVEGVKHIFFL
jgi:multiple antibiotic resistance protein